jgi:hypothetical protein
MREWRTNPAQWRPAGSIHEGVVSSRVSGVSSESWSIRTLPARLAAIAWSPVETGPYLMVIPCSAVSSGDR